MYVSLEFHVKLRNNDFLKRTSVLKYAEFLARFPVRKGWCATEVAQTGSLPIIPHTNSQE